MKPTAYAAAVALTLPLLATTSVSALAVTTEEFVNKVTISDMFEVQSGKLAADKAENEDVQDFGEQMVDDHSKTTDQLMELIQDEEVKVQPPTELDQKHKANLDKLKNLSGAKFDQTYIPMQVLAHEQAVNLFQDYSKSGDNDALKDWASDTLPTLKEHLEEARDLNQQLSKPANTAAAGDDNKAMDNDKSAMTDRNDRANADRAGNMATGEMAANRAADRANADRANPDRTAANDADRAGDKQPPKPPFDYVTSQSPTDWTAETLIGKSVENKKGEALGEVNNVVLNEKGRVVAITVGVGGFLGLGEKDVGVPFDALSFRDEDAVDRNNDANDTADANADDADHDNEVIVIDATKEQLEAAPDFVWLGEKRDKRAEADADNESTVE